MKTQNKAPVRAALAVTLLLELTVIPWAGAGTWLTTGSMGTARRNHSATLLSDGRVLVAGGYNGTSGLLSSAELYDLATAMWTASSGAMQTARENHTATLLPNGKVLVAGGYDGASGMFSSAELYDPASGTWTATGSMTTRRVAHTATLLANGKVLITGGAQDLVHYNWSAEVYDPGTGTWTGTGSMATRRAGHTATLLPSGKVLVAGGYNSTDGHLSSAEVYDPANGTWTTTGSMSAGRYYHTATLRTSGDVLVAGGRDNSGALSSAERYDPSTGTWIPAATLLNAHYYHTATLLPSGVVLVAGGFNSSGYLDNTETYWRVVLPPPYPSLDGWDFAGWLQQARGQHTATLLPNGRVLVAGGYNNPSGYLSSAELFEPYDSTSGTWTASGGMTIPRESHAATLLSDGRVLVAGGATDRSGYYVNSAEIYEPNAQAWTPTLAMTCNRGRLTLTLLTNGNVLAFGGHTVCQMGEVYNPTTRTWLGTSLTTPRYYHTATLLTNGRVLIAGGYDSGHDRLASAELFYQYGNYGAFVATGAMNGGRGNHTATLLPDGQVLVVGGSGQRRAELYDPSTGKWTLTNAMSVVRSWHTATLLPSGKVLVAGGGDASPWATAELYNPTDGSWMPTGSMTTPRTCHTATLLPNGKVLVAGGGSALASAELYDPATGTWSATGALGTGRSFHTATLLASRKVLVTGGGGVDISVFSSSELYDVGLGSNPSWQPQITSANSPLYVGTSLTLTGMRFRGVSEASGGNGCQNSPSDNPVVQLRAIEGGQTMFLQAASWSPTSYSSALVSGLPLGYALLTVFVNGIPSTSSIIDIAPTALLDAGLRAYDGSAVIKLACERGSQPTSPLCINKNGTSYSILLTPTDAPDASKFRIQTSSGVKALMKLP